MSPEQVNAIIKPIGAIAKATNEVSIQIRTADEIGQLADYFDQMVGEFTEKELIKDMFGKYVVPRIVKGLLRDNQALDSEHQRMRSAKNCRSSRCDGITSAASPVSPAR